MKTKQLRPLSDADAYFDLCLQKDFNHSLEVFGRARDLTDDEMDLIYYCDWDAPDEEFLDLLSRKTLATLETAAFCIRRFSKINIPMLSLLRNRHVTVATPFFGWPGLPVDLLGKRQIRALEIWTESGRTQNADCETSSDVRQLLKRGDTLQISTHLLSTKQIAHLYEKAFGLPGAETAEHKRERLIEGVKKTRQRLRKRLRSVLASVARNGGDDFRV